MSTISLLTDFGNKDWYAGLMKAVVYRVNPTARIVDLTHEIANHSVEQGAFVLASSFSYFPYGSIHVAVVDPGVGSARAPILLESRGHFFIGPDNGLFSLVDHPTSTLYLLDKKEYWLPEVSETFHGRDIFAPVAGALSRGVPADQLGSIVARKIHRLAPEEPKTDAQGVHGKVMHVDRFGNCVTNIAPSALPGRDGANVTLSVAGKSVPVLWRKTYEEADKGPAVLVGSTGYLELALYREHFSRQYGVTVGDKILLATT